MKHNIGILIFGDPTRGGTIASEVKFLQTLYEYNKDDCDFYIITVNPTITKKVIRDKQISYNFPHKNVTIFNDEDIKTKLYQFSCLLSYPGHSNFFGGYLNDNVVKFYKAISYFTNVINRNVFIRINDSEIKVRDYRLLSKQRLDAGFEAREQGKPDSAFMKDPLNVNKATDIVSWKQWNYANVYWFANGSKESCDWVAETLYDREDPYFRMTDKESFVRNTIYVSDDIFFLVRKNYQRFEKKYSCADSFQEKQEKFCYIGFFDTVNMARAKSFNTLFKENLQRVPMKIFGKGTEILGKLKGKTNIEIEEGFIKGDSEEYFDFLNKHLAYIFIGKGQSESRYIGKTVYDAIVARTPVAVYKNCDSKMITFSNPEFYFENENELKVIFEKLKDPATRMKWIEEQANEIFRKLPPSEFRFSKYGEQLEELNDSFVYNPSMVVSAKPIKTTIDKSKSVELF